MVTESAGQDCFLCRPDEKLTYVTSRVGFALCGLGPILPGYSVVATHEHVRSAADIDFAVVNEFVEFASTVRARLASAFGSCVLTEHGRLPVCVDVSGTTDPHCFHAHFLLFPGAPEIDQQARSYFAQVRPANSFAQALATARATDEYFLLSSDPEHFLIMTRPGRLIRQFARLLVADALGHPELADWRHHSSHEEALKGAKELRDLLTGEK
jgi:diadenosine tetraphosphate (Ap4A) HIT family hydrolase